MKKLLLKLIMASVPAMAAPVYATAQNLQKGD